MLFKFSPKFFPLGSGSRKENECGSGFTALQYSLFMVFLPVLGPRTKVGQSIYKAGKEGGYKLQLASIVISGEQNTSVRRIMAQIVIVLGNHGSITGNKGG